MKSVRLLSLPAIRSGMRARSDARGTGGPVIDRAWAFWGLAGRRTHPDRCVLRFVRMVIW